MKPETGMEFLQSAAELVESLRRFCKAALDADLLPVADHYAQIGLHLEQRLEMLAKALLLNRAVHQPIAKEGSN